MRVGCPALPREWLESLLGVVSCLQALWRLFLEGGEGENCGLSLHFADLKTAVIFPLLYLVHSFLDTASRCGVFRSAPLSEIICVKGVEDMSGKHSGDVVDVHVKECR